MWRYVYCLEYHKDAPDGKGTFSYARNWTNRKVAYAYYWGAVYYYQTCRWPAYSTNNWQLDYFVTQWAIHILNGERSLSSVTSAINRSSAPSYKFIDTPAATISSLIIGLFLFGRHHMERSTRRVSPALLSPFTQEFCHATDVFHKTFRVFECIGIDLLQDVAFCPLPRRYRDGIRLVNMSFAIRNRL